MATAPTEGAAIVLAAGFSSRFGSDKRVAKLGTQTLLDKVCNIYAKVFDRVIVVLRTDDPLLSSSFDDNIEVVVTDRASEGMSQSLIAGINVAIDEPWVVVALADMPFVNESTLRMLKSELCKENGSIVRLTHANRFGNPVGFPRCYFEHLLTLTGDQGARQLFQNHNLRIVSLEVEDPGIHIDFDTPELLQRHTSNDLSGHSG